MKPSNKYPITVAVIALIGAIISLALSIPSALAFALGAIICGIVTKQFFFSTTSEVANSATQTSKTLYVGNLPYRANESDVKKLFAEHGEVYAVRLMKDKRTGKRRGFGFVVMSSRDISNAIAKLNNKEYGERTLKVREANDPKPADNPESNNS